MEATPDQEQHAFGVVLALWRNRRKMTKRALAEAMGYDRSYISHIESGRYRASEDFVRRAEAALSAAGELWRSWQDAPGRQLSGGDRTNRRDALRLGTALVAGGLLARAEDEAWELTRRSEQTDLGAASLARLREAVSGYGRDYARYSAGELWQDARRDRHHVAQLLEGRMTLRQRRELYVTAAWLSLVIAWAAHDRGDVRAALAYASDARHHADQADHAEAVAWSWDVAATTWLYEEQPDQALRAAQHGMAAAPANSAAQVRLTGQLARAHARLGHTTPADEALGRLRRQAERYPAHAAGLFTADAVRALSAAATSSLWLGHYEQARMFGAQAMEVYEQDPTASPTRRAITALDLGIACARLGDPEEAVAHGLIALTTSRQAVAIATRSSALCQILEHADPNSAVIAQLRQRMAESALRRSNEITDGSRCAG
ncbi:helix-turn-helix transcriptional regulator [Nonomuraea sp. NPDC052129]|uniref:helix-turn-helix transcriptional regulator n=1 Tax=Nonomuraea sp. NPDC052129 TaxID=3154651 RepID=UPI003440A3AB